MCFALGTAVVYAFMLGLPWLTELFGVILEFFRFMFFVLKLGSCQLCRLERLLSSFEL